MKKLIAVLLAAMLVLSVMTIGFVAVAADGEAPADGAGTDGPDWLNRLIDRLMQVIAKLLLKLNIKLALRTGPVLV